ncbi:hypothetical protein HanXRQr2_Chr09g0365191 [Helianthus annuus]|uniref:Uncharacterized protein n=1 Tax=Helianthus annuus TaxID=4232 RepID=A0A9K3I2P1_HELAN|nr:hypothetical protein HanXRQr2_Chr09g0365191 [Helianthus annuus]KAJ0891282.1 hypothetical protein HanPSC8_Chr09g0351881 [Helianthus annuus]
MEMEVDLFRDIIPFHDKILYENRKHHSRKHESCALVLFLY